MDIRLPKDPQFNKYYTKHCKYLKLKPKLSDFEAEPHFMIQNILLKQQF